MCSSNSYQPIVSPHYYYLIHSFTLRSYFWHILIYFHTNFPGIREINFLTEVKLHNTHPTTFVWFIHCDASVHHKLHYKYYYYNCLVWNTSSNVPTKSIEKCRSSLYNSSFDISISIILKWFFKLPRWKFGKIFHINFKLSLIF